MTSRRAVSPRGLLFIEAHEGFRARAARLPDGRWVLGYSSIEDDAEGREITQDEAEARLKSDLAPIEDVLDAEVFAPLSEGQLDALASLAFSIGLDAFRRSGVLEALNDGRPLDAAEVFDRWRQARVGDVVKPVDALVRRRAAEKAMFLALESGPVAASSALLRPVQSLAAESARAPDGAAETAAVVRRAAPDPDLIERLNRILPPRPPVERPSEAAARTEAAGWTPSVALPSPAHAARKSAAPAALPGRRRSAPLPGLPAAKDGTAPSAGNGARWPWITGGGGLALIAVGLDNIRAEGAPADGASSGAGWALAALAGLVAAAACVYAAARQAARRWAAPR